LSTVQLVVRDTAGDERTKNYNLGQQILENQKM
jgi:hypothetical protein